MNDPAVKSLVSGYRRKFYREPLGMEAFDGCLMEEAMFISRDTMKKAESFHQEYCCKCGSRSAIKLTNDGYNYYFTCENICC